MFSPIFRELIRPVRATLIEELKLSDGLPVADLARTLDMSYMGVKQHCIDLEKAGFLTQRRIPRTAVGRPERLYQLTPKCDELFPVAGVDMTLMVLEEISALFGEAAAEKVLYRFFQKRKADWQSKVAKGKSLVEKATRLAELRDKSGAFSKCEYDRNVGFRMEEFHNPLQAIFNKYPNAVRMDLTMMEELLGTQIERTELVKKGAARRVVYLIKTLG